MDSIAFLFISIAQMCLLASFKLREKRDYMTNDELLFQGALIILFHGNLLLFASIYTRTKQELHNLKKVKEIVRNRKRKRL